MILTKELATQQSANQAASRVTLAWLVGAVVCALAMWGYVAWVLVPYQESDSVQTGAPRGNLSDLYPRWLGSRELLLHGTDPYSREVVEQIQQGYYGVVLDPTNPAHPKDQQGFAYPVYVTFLLAPLVLLPFDVVQNAFGWLLIAVTALSVPLWLRALKLDLSPLATVAVAIFAVGSFPTVQGYSLQQLTLIVTCGIAAAMALLAGNRLMLAGVVLAVATIKPQLVALLLVGLAIWSLGRLRERQRLWWGFGATMIVLLAGSELLSPGWIPRFLTALNDYQRYTSGVSLINTLTFNTFLGPILTVFLVALTLYFWWVAGREAEPGPAFAEAQALTMAVTLLIIPTWAPYNQVLLLPALLLLIHYARRAWRDGGRLARYGFLLSGAALGWPWLSALGLVIAVAVASLFGAAPEVWQFWTVPLYTSLFIPLAVLLTLFAARPKKESQEPSKP